MRARAKPDSCRQGRLVERGEYDLDQIKAKMILAKQIAEVLCVNNFTQLSAAEVLGIDQPKVSRLLNGHLAEFSIERLLRFLSLLGSEVEIVIRKPLSPSQGQVGRLLVVGDRTTT